MVTHPKGSAPDVFWFDPTCDRSAGLGRPYTPSQRVRDVAADLEALPLFLAGAGDVVAVRQRPAEGFLRRLQAAGFTVPEFAVCAKGGGAPPALRRRRLNRLRPWGWSPAAAAWAEPLFGQLPPNAVQRPKTVWHEGVRALYSKAWSAAFLGRFLEAHPEEAARLCEPGAVGVACVSAAEAETAAVRIREARGTGVLVKAAFGAAGQDQVRLSAPPAPLWRDGAQRRHVERLLGEQGTLVVEPLLDRVLDFGFQLDVPVSGDVRFTGLSRFVTDGRGQYLGSFVHPLDAGLGDRERGLLCGDGRDLGYLERIAGALADPLAAELAPAGYSGPLGIDAMVYREGDGLRLKPVVEVNPRYTMGRVALAMARRVSAARTALWLVLRVQDIRRAGFAGALDFARHLEARHPVRRVEAAGHRHGARVDGGVVCTNDPGAAGGVLSLLVVAESLAGCGAVFEGLGALQGVIEHFGAPG